MHVHRLSALNLGRKGAGVGLAALATLAAAFATTTPAAAATLWNQYDNATGAGIPSVNYDDPGSTIHSAEAADDVVVPVSDTWRVKNVRVDGIYSSGGGPVPSVNVAFYRNNSGLPGRQIYSATGLIPSAGLVSGDFVIPLSTPAELKAGRTFWVSVQANFFSADEVWNWTDRSVQSGNPAAWKNPGNGSGTGCTSFAPRATTCGSDPTAPDQVFKLIGRAVPVP